MVEVNWTESAISDLNSIGEYIAQDSYRFASITVERLFHSTDILENNPQSGRIVPELENKDVRELIHGNYRIVYKIRNPELIDVLTVHHSKRLISNNPSLKNFLTR